MGARHFVALIPAIAGALALSEAGDRQLVARLSVLSGATAWEAIEVVRLGWVN